MDDRIAIDVKNSRRPVNGPNFYVEHTVPRFKLDRQGCSVRIAGLLSPYLQLKYLREPAQATGEFKVNDLAFLGETSCDDIERLVSMFASDTLEVKRAIERTVPNWVFGLPHAFYKEFVEKIRRFASECDWPDGKELQHVLDDSEMENAIPAIRLTGKPLPQAIVSRLSKWQVEFYSKSRRFVG